MKAYKVNSFCEQVDDSMLYGISEKIVRENAFEQKKRKPGLNLTLGQALIGLRTTGLRMLALGLNYRIPMATEIFPNNSSYTQCRVHGAIK